MPIQKIPFPASPNGGYINVDIADFITQSINVDIPNSFPFETTLNPTTPTTPPVEPPVTPPTTAGYKLTAEEQWDKLNSLSPNQIGVTSETASLAKYFSTTIVKEGVGAFKSIVPAGGNSLSSGNRSEQQYNDAAHNPKEGAVEYWAYYDNWDALRGHSGHTVQWHPNTSGASACLSLQNYSGTYEVVKSIRGVNTRIQNVKKAVVQNKWTKHRWEFNLSANSDGYCRLWIDDVLICNYKGATADGSGEYFKIGQNKWLDMPRESVVIYDALRIYAKV